MRPLTPARATSVRSCLLMLCLVGGSALAAPPASAAKGKNEAEVASIRNRWQAVEQRARASTEEGGFYITEVKANARATGGFPAVGVRHSTITYEWEWNEDTEEKPYDVRLLRATEESVIAGRSYRLTFLFGPDGKVIFCHSRPAEPEDAEGEEDFLQPRGEWRFYFKDGRELRRMRGAKIIDTPSRQEELDVDPLIDRADELKRLFAQTEQFLR
ncbi:hypothetical protein [Hyalangium gracile]|uniref:hypothetical protein n=1 Tax=Hyalangium gracile TaxID=394092 RepID=UPI001CCBA18D|nr:hypothetical protein [Hyalangium gracile]